MQVYLHGNLQAPRQLQHFVHPEVASVAEWQAIIGNFVQSHVKRSGASGVVVGLSGGIDSAVTAALCVHALGPERVTVVALPHQESDPADLAIAKEVAEHLGLPLQVREITSAVEATASATETKDPHLLGNIKARCRMNFLYATASKENRLVAGTGNKTELLIGYFTKWGDGAADFEPIGDLWKTQVWELARAMQLPKSVIDRVPTAGLTPGQTDEGDLGMSYNELDSILKCVELNTPEHEIERRTGTTPEMVARALRLVRGSEHKRHMPLIPKIGARTVGIDWRRSVHWDC